MAKIYFRKILEYDPTFDGKSSKFEGYKKILLEIENPNIVDKQNHKLDIPKNINDTVFCSSLNRGLQTACKYFPQYRVIELDELKEIKFNLQSLLTKEEYKTGGSDLVRERFIEAFVDDSLAEEREEIKNRILLLINKFSKLEGENYLAISHSFFMKIFQTYLIDKNLFENPTLIKKYFNPKQKTFDFGKGFDVTL